MIDLYYLLIFVAIFITSRADTIPERNRREGEQVRAEIAEGGGDGDQSFQSPNSLPSGGLNVAGESFGSESNAVPEYDGEGQLNGDNTIGEYSFVPPSDGLGYGNQLVAGAQASIPTEVQTGEQAQYADLIQADATAQSSLQAQFGQGLHHGEEIQADFQENEGVQYSELPTFLPPTQGIIQHPYGTTPGTLLNYGLLEPSVYSNNLKKINIYKENSMLVPYSTLLNKPGPEPGSLYAGQRNTVPSNPSNDYGSPAVGTIPQPNRGMYTSISHTGPVSTPYKQSLPISATGNDVTQSPNWIPYQKGNPTNLYNVNNNWNPYTKPAEGETLVQVDGEIHSGGKTEADTVLQEIDKRSPTWITYQKGNPNKSVLQTDIISQNSYNNWNPYTKPAEGETLVQIDGEIHNGGKTEADTVLQEIGKGSPTWILYQKENPNKSVLQTDVISPNSYNNWNPYTKPAEGETLIQPDEEIQGAGKTYAGTVVQGTGVQNPIWIPYQKRNPNKSLVQNDGGVKNKYNEGYFDGEGFQANAVSHLGNGAQFDAVAGANTIVPASSVVEARFRHTARPNRRPLLAFAPPRDRWQQG